MANGNGVAKWINVPNIIGSITIILLVWAGNGISENKETANDNQNVNKVQDGQICENKSDIKDLKSKQEKDHDSLITLAGELKNTNTLLSQTIELNKALLSKMDK